MTDLIGLILGFFNDLTFWKKKKERRKFEKENNLPKKLMINPLTKLLIVAILFILVLRVVRAVSYGSNKGENSTIERMTEIRNILEKNKNKDGEYPKKLSLIIRNNPLRKNITVDFWGNNFYYEITDNRQKYSLISKGKDGLINTQDDITD